MSGAREETDSLVCPSCARGYPSGSRFCSSCRVPLIYDSRLEVLDDVSDRHRRARKVKPQLAEGQLVHVAGARNQAEAEFIQGLLLEEGVPSMLRRTAGFDVPDYLAAGPRDVLVPQSAWETARQVLLQAELIDERAATASRPVAPGKLLVGLLAALALGALLVWLGTQAIH